MAETFPHQPDVFLRASLHNVAQFVICSSQNYDETGEGIWRLLNHYVKDHHFLDLPSPLDIPAEDKSISNVSKDECKIFSKTYRLHWTKINMSDSLIDYVLAERLPNNFKPTPPYMDPKLKFQNNDQRPLF
jgi:hypothetical protein